MYKRQGLGRSLAYSGEIADMTGVMTNILVIAVLAALIDQFVLENLKHRLDVYKRQMDAWVLVAAVLVSGLAGLIGLGRTGIRVFWASDDRSTPRLRVIEAGPVSYTHLDVYKRQPWTPGSRSPGCPGCPAAAPGRGSRSRR